MNQGNNLDKERIEKGREDRKLLIKSYIDRLSQGEDLDIVREEFVENFETVEASEIAIAEQELIQSGVPLEDVQRLCDVHSALFHGKTREEKIVNAEKAVASSFEKETEEAEKAAKEEKTALDLRMIPGHPLQVFMDENEVLEVQIKKIRELANGNNMDKLQEDLKDLRLNLITHYSRKGDLIYPLLNRTYGFSGPSDVMWGVDGEIRDDIGAIVGLGTGLADFEEKLEKVLNRAEEMIYKENNILFPLCTDKFSEEDWMRIYYELFAYESFLEEGQAIWHQAEEKREELKVIGGKLARDRREEVDIKQDIVLGSGHMTVEQTLAVLNTIPMELTFIDDKDTNRFFSDHTPRFKRPDMAIDRDFHSCHPPKAARFASDIIEEFRAGSRDKYEFFRYLNDEPVYIRYLAVRDENGKYLGTLEAVEELDFAEKHFNTRKRRNTNL